jgi:hypothetical protein
LVFAQGGITWRRLKNAHGASVSNKANQHTIVPISTSQKSLSETHGAFIKLFEAVASTDSTLPPKNME